MRLNKQLSKLDKIGKNLDASIMTNDQVDEEMKMLRLVMAQRGIDD
jgi:hypothetical protein